MVSMSRLNRGVRVWIVVKALAVTVMGSILLRGVGVTVIVWVLWEQF